MRVGTFAAILFFLLTCAVEFCAIQESSSSTAALGYLVLPFLALAFSAAGFGLGWLWARLLPSGKTSALRLPRLIAANLLLLGFVMWGVSEVSTWLATRRTVLDVQNMTATQLDSMVRRPDLIQNKFVLAALAENPNATPEVLHRIVVMNRRDLYQPNAAFLSVPSRNRKGLAVMRLVALNPNTRSVDLKVLAAHTENVYLLGDLARRKDLDPETIRLLVRSENSVIQFGLATNPNAPEDALRRLAASTDEYTRANVAGNPSTPLGILRILASDLAFHVRVRVAMNPSASDDIIAALTKDMNENVRRVAAERSH